MPKQTATQLVKEIEVELEKVKDRVQDLGWEVKTLQAKAKELERILNNTRTELVPRVEYNLLRTIVFGLVGLITTAVMAALVGQVVVG